MPAIAIVGRKNVGKSTIFNRLVGMRASIVYKEPGVTRDRLYGEVAWCGRTFDVIDTGGFFPNEEIALAKKISRQIEQALGEASLIFFVVDARAGLLPGDADIGQRLRRSGKPVFLLVNKTDRLPDEVKTHEFARLGYRDCFPVSAEAGIGFGEVLDAALALLPREAPAKKDPAIKIIIVGRPNAGKSTLFNAILKQERAIVDDKPGTTRDLINARFRHQNRNFEIIDTAGLRRKARVHEPIEFYSMMRVLHYLDQVDIVIIIVDVAAGVVKEDRRIAAIALAKARGLVIAANKIDLVGKKNQARIVPAIKSSFDYLDFVPVAPVCAREGTGIEPLLNHVVHVHAELNKSVKPDLLVNVTGSLTPPPGGAITGVVQVGKNPPVFNVGTTVALRENYLQYLRRMLRNYFGFAGVPILIRTKRRGVKERPPPAAARSGGRH